MDRRGRRGSAAERSVVAVASGKGLIDCATTARGAFCPEGCSELEEEIGPLDARRHLGDQLLEHRRRLRSPSPDEPDGRAREGGAAARLCGIVGRQLGGQLVQLGRRRRAAATGALGGHLQLRGNGCIGPVGGEREVAGPLLDVRDGARQRSVHRAPLPDRRLLVADARRARDG